MITLKARTLQPHKMPSLLIPRPIKPMKMALPLDRLLALLTSVLWPFLELRERLTRPLLAKLYE
jgi:hypothetical protein